MGLQHLQVVTVGVVKVAQQLVLLAQLIQAEVLGLVVTTVDIKREPQVVQES
jgi:hypothetical protein